MIELTVKSGNNCLHRTYNVRGIGPGRHQYHFILLSSAFVMHLEKLTAVFFVEHGFKVKFLFSL